MLFRMPYDRTAVGFNASSPEASSFKLPLDNVFEWESKK